MGESSLNIAKIKAYDDLKRMVKFLQEEQDSIDGSANKREFFRKNLETIFESNFKSKILVEEFESMIFDICISKTLIMGNLSEDKLRKNVYDSVLHFNIRNKNLISEKLAMAVADDPRQKGRVKALVETTYREVVLPIMSDIIKKLIPKKDIDSREIIAIVKKERYDIDTVTISKTFSKELKIYHESNQGARKNPAEMKRRFGSGRVDNIKRDSRAPGAKTAVEKMNLVVNREKKKKDEFIRLVEGIQFKLGETFLDDNTRVFVHNADFKQKKIIIISYALEGEIDNVSLLFEDSTGNKHGEEFFFDLGELEAIDEKVMPAFVKSKLGIFTKALGVKRTLEAIWFLLNVLTVERKLPLKTVEFMENAFLHHLEDIETGIYKAAVQQAIQS